MASAERELKQAIEFVQQKNYEAGAMMLNAVLKRPELSYQNKAIAYVWLAETQNDINFKIQCLSQAQDFDPQNPMIVERLNTWLARQPRRTPYPTQRQAPQQTQPPAQANPLFPESVSIELPPAEMSDSQQMRTIGQQPRGTTTSMNRIPDDEQRSRIFDRISPPQPTGKTGPLTPTNIQNPQPRGQSLQPPHLNRGQQQGGQPPQQGFNNQPPFPQNQNLDDSRPINPFSSPNLSDSQTFNSVHTQTGKPHKITQMPRVVGIKHGPNGGGNGVFVTLDGLIATTRNVVGGNLQVMVEIDSNYETTGRVVRSFPALDLALVQVNVELDRVWPPTNVPVIMDGEAFVSVNYSQDVLRGNHRRSGGQLEPHWITTTVRLDYIRGAGGDAMYDTNNYLIGLLTRNASRETGYVYGLHILHIYNKVREYLRERQQMPNAGYCNHCGNLSRAQLYGGYYCETCGALRPGMDKIDREHRSSPQLLQIYNENLSRTCPKCRARVGYHNAKCLRCGFDLDKRI